MSSSLDDLDFGGNAGRVSTPGYGQSNTTGTQFGNSTYNSVNYYIDAAAYAVTAGDLTKVGVSDEEEQEILQVYVGEKATVEHLIDRLEQRRILLLVGNRFMGKGATALYLATRTAEQRDLENSTWRINLSSRQSIDIRGMAGEERAFGRRATIFSNALANREFAAVFARGERSELQQLADALRKNHAYWILTATPDEIAACRSVAVPHVAFHQMLPLDSISLTEVFERRLGWLETQGCAAERISLARAHREQMVDDLKFVGRICDFMSFFVAGDNDFETAFREFRDARQWFNDDLARDVDAWCAATALAIAQPVAPEPIPWLDFERLRRTVSERILSDEEMFPRNGKDESRTGGSAQGVSDGAMLSRCRATVIRNESGGGDVVRFAEESFGPALWAALLSNHRRVLTRLIPTLRGIAERDRTSGRSSLRALATQAIGRIGEIDPTRITFPLLRHWASGEPAQRKVIGHLLQGIVGAKSQAYLDDALRELDKLITSEGTDLLTIVTAYWCLGELRPDIAMQRMGVIAVDHVSPAMENLQKVTRWSEILDTHADLRRGKAAKVLRQRGQVLAMLAEALSEEQAEAVVALARAVAYVALFNGDVVAVLDMMSDWIARGGERASVLVALLFLHDGIADSFDDLVAEARQAGHDDTVHPVLFALKIRKNAADDLAIFMADVHAAINGTYTLPASLEKKLEERFSTCLETWAREAVEEATTRAAAMEFFLALTAVRGRTVCNTVLAALSQPAFHENDRMREFAVDIRGRIRK